MNLKLLSGIVLAVLLPGGIPLGLYLMYKKQEKKHENAKSGK